MPGKAAGAKRGRKGDVPSTKHVVDEDIKIDQRVLEIDMKGEQAVQQW